MSAQGHIVTDRRLTEGCQVIVASGLGDADRVADDKDNGLALLRVYGPRKMSPLTLAHDAPKAGDLTLVGIPDPKEQDGSRKLTEIKARLSGRHARSNCASRCRWRDFPAPPRSTRRANSSA